MKKSMRFLLLFTTALVFAFSLYTPALAEGETETGWKKEEGKWYYVDPATNSNAIGWLKVSDKWYYFAEDGVMSTGWQQIDNDWFYLNPSGAMQTGWIKPGGSWYWLESSGKMATGWIKTGGSTYYLKDTGAMVTGWQQISSKWYYFSTSGAMQTGWIKPGGSWYWLDSNGVMVTGTKVIDGQTHQFSSTGAWQGQSGGSGSSFSQLAPTTRMSFQELVGDNGDYNKIQKFPAKGTYKIIVDLHHQVVMAYKKDSKGNYTVPVRYMVTTTGGPKTPTPVGTYGLKDTRKRFSQFSTGEFAQYWTKVVGEIYFHSLLYTRANANNYMEASYRLLGSRGSHGCIRLLVPDARWIYYNVAPGSTIQIRSGSASDTATANIKKQLTRAALPKTRPNCNGVGNTDVWSISGLNASLK